MKTLLISHENDIDGIGAVVLAKLAFPELDYLLYPSVSVLETNFRRLLEEGSLASYDEIFITDLALANPSLEMVAKDPVLSSKIHILDHHQASIKDHLDIYKFTTITEVRPDGRKTCGTEMFYEYLLNRNLLTKTSILDDLTDLTRLEDTWAWKDEGERGLYAHDLAILLSAIGIEPYIEAMYNKVKSDDKELTLTSEEQALVEEKKREYEAKLQSLWEDTAILTDDFGNTFGVVFADYEYRNELAEYIRKQTDKKSIKYIVIIALEKGLYGQKSYRSIDPNTDVNEIAMFYGGGGHKEASSVNITEEQKAKCLTLAKRESLEYLAKSKFNK